MLYARDFEFFWTARRRRYWRQCRRKYFLHYYGARGGHDENAPRALREIYAAKKTIMLDVYLRRTVNGVMRELFYAPYEDGPEDRQKNALLETAQARAQREFRAMLEGKNPVTLFELAQGGVSVSALYRELQEKLGALCRRLEETSWGFFRGIPFPDRRYLDSPLALSVAELRCYLAPLFAVRRAGELWLIEGAGHTDDGDAIAVLGKFAAATLWKTPPEKVRTFLFSGDGAESFGEIGRDADASEALRGIRRDVDEMLAAIRPDGTIREEDFPADGSGCGDCVFRAVCGKECARR